MAGTRIELAPDWQEQLFGMATGPLDTAATIVAAGQKRRIPVSEDGSYGRPAGYARDRIHVERGRDAEGPYRDVGSDATTPAGYPYPLGLEVGVRPHTIVSHGDYPLRDKHGHIFGRIVDHPGNKPFPWCRAALADIAGMVFRT
jgi:hypothetical protein